MKLFMTGFKNISKPTLTSYLINYYYINVYNKYYTNNNYIYPNKSKLLSHHNIPFKINYFVPNKFCFIIIYDPIFYFKILNTQLKIRICNIININGAFTKKYTIYNIYVKKFKQYKLYIYNINDSYTHNKIYNVLNIFPNYNKPFTINLKPNYKTGRHNNSAVIKIFNINIYKMLLNNIDNFKNKYNFIIQSTKQ